LVLIVFEKEEKKKENLVSVPFSPQRPIGPTSPPAAARLPALLFLSFCITDSVALPISPPSPSSRPFPSSVQDRHVAGIPALHRASSVFPLPAAGSNQEP
jgi:hypothetical protein